MDKFPKRRKDRDNPYALGFNTNTNRYTVTFLDSFKVSQTIEITEEMYLEFNKFELEDLSYMNKFDRHIEHLEQTEESIYNRTLRSNDDICDLIFNDILSKELKKEINNLPDIQKRRVKMYFFDSLTLKKISEIEGCSIRSVKYSVDIAIDKLAKKLKKYKF